MTVRTGPTEESPTHHIQLEDINGTKVGLILCNPKGEPTPSWTKNPIDRTAIKRTSGGGSYDDFEYPYSPITQDDWSGGRGGLDFERDSTKFYDSYRVNTHRENMITLGPREHYSKGYKVMDYRTEITGTRDLLPATDGTTPDPPYAILSFTPSSDYTLKKLWIMLRNSGAGFVVDPPELTTFTLKDSTTTVGTLTYTHNNKPSSRDNIRWFELTADIPIVTTETYTLEINQAAGIDPYVSGLIFYTAGSSLADSGAENGAFIAETDAINDACIFFEYKGQQYMALSKQETNIAPTIWMNGDRGVTSNTTELDRVIDGSKSWTVDQWIGCTVKILRGLGHAQKTLYRTITSNTATELMLDTDWEHRLDTTTEYAILGSDTWQEVTGHGLTQPLTDVLVADGIVYFAQGDFTVMRSYREYNNAGVWTAAWNEETAYAVQLIHQPLSNKIWRAQNQDATGVVSVSSATPAAFGTDLTFGTAIPVGDAYSFINGMAIYTADNGTEALWVFKEDIPYIVTDTAEEISLTEMKTIHSRYNGAANLVQGVYIYFSLGNGLERYYGGNVESIGPNLGEGLPADRSGPITAMLGYPGRFFAIVDGGAAGYSSLLERAGSGWHEVYRAPLGERLKAMGHQVIPGDAIDRLWLYQGNIAIWLPMASNATSEIKDPNYTYTHEGSIILSRMHAGMYDTQKFLRRIKVWSQNFLNLFVDYRIENENEDTEWINIDTLYNEVVSPFYEIDLTAKAATPYGLSFKRLQLRLTLINNSGINNQGVYHAAALKAIVLDAVTMVNVKYMYQMTVRVMDDEPSLTPREMDDKSVTAASMSAITKLQQLEDWADASSAGGLLKMTSTSPLYHNKFVFLNPPSTQQIAEDPDTTRQWTGNAFVCSMTVQEA